MKFLLFVLVFVPIVWAAYRLTRHSFTAEMLFIAVAAVLQALVFIAGWSNLTGAGGVFVFLWALPVVAVLFAVELLLLLGRYSRARATAFLALVAVQFAALALVYYFASTSNSNFLIG
ncbi:MAG: hypothetical protein WBO07_02945 [Formosimonas sp.]|jgi:hypothetical protein